MTMSFRVSCRVQLQWETHLRLEVVDSTYGSDTKRLWIQHKEVSVEALDNNIMRSVDFSC